MTTIGAGTASALLTALITVVDCSADTPPGVASAPASDATSAATGLRLVALGDSSSTGAGGTEGGGWVRRYADLLQAKTGQPVEVLNRASKGQASDSLASQVESNQALRDELAQADYIVIGAGGADLNDGDDAWAAGSCSGPACYTTVLADYRTNIARVASSIAELRTDKPTVFRAVTPPNVLTGAEKVIPPFLRATATEIGVLQARSARESTCTALRAHGGECIDVLTAFNGADGTTDAYASGLLNLTSCCYGSAQGQQRMAELLIQTGPTDSALPGPAARGGPRTRRA